MPRASIALAGAIALFVALHASSQAADPASTPPTLRPAELAAMDNASLIEKVMALQDQLAKALQRCESANAHLAQSADERARLLKENAQLKEQLSTTQPASANVNDATVRKQLAQREAEVDQLRTELTHGLAQTAKAQADLEAMRANSDRANKNYNDVSVKLTEVSTQRDFLLQQVKLLREQIAIIQDRLNKAAPAP